MLPQGMIHKGCCSGTANVTQQQQRQIFALETRLGVKLSTQGCLWSVRDEVEVKCVVQRIVWKSGLKSRRMTIQTEEIQHINVTTEGNQNSQTNHAFQNWTGGETNLLWRIFAFNCDSDTVLATYCRKCLKMPSFNISWCQFYLRDQIAVVRLNCPISEKPMTCKNYFIGMTLW